MLRISGNIFYKIIVILFLVGWGSSVFGQFPGSASVDAGPDQEISCDDSDPCVELSAELFITGGTESYTVSSIPYNPPVSYTEPGGTPVSVGTDDVWSPQINLPFEFCLFGQLYNTAKIGSNGAIGLGNITATSHPWSFSASVPSSALSNAGQILGCYHDMNPNYGGTVKWYLLGNYPDRALVVVFNELPHFSCTNLRSTFMMVLYETTNVIDVYIQKKETCTGWNGGRAVVGIQNPAGNLGYTPPGRNTGAWTVNANQSEAWRFFPAETPTYEFEWLDENGTVVGTTETIEVCPGTSTFYVAKATYIPCGNDNPITVQDTVHITLDESVPQIIMPDNMDICLGEEITLTADNQDPDATLSWSHGVQNGVPFTPTNIGENIYTATSENDNCSSSATVVVTVHGDPPVDAGENQMVCAGESITLSANGANTYVWDNDILDNTPFIPEETLTYTVIGTDIYGCEATDQITISVFPIPNASISGDNASISGNNTVCVGDSNPNVVLVGENGVPPYTFTYTTNGGAPETIVSTGNNALLPVPTDAEGTFTYNLLLVSDSGPLSCENVLSEEVIITVHSNPTGTIHGGGSVCADEPPLEMLFIGEGSTSDYIFTYSINGYNQTSTTNQSNSITIPVQTSVAGTYNYTLTNVMDTETGCSTNLDLSQTVVIYPNPVASFYPDPFDLDSYNSTSTMVNNTTGASSYYWDFGDGNSSTSSSPTHTFHTDESEVFAVTLIATSNDGCIDSMKALVNYVEDVIFFIPNSFTPDNDQFNESFKPVFTSGFDPQTYSLYIYNRWGELLFESHDANVGWDGTYGLKSEGNVKAGTYIWRIEFKEKDYDKHHSFNGIVNLIK